MQEVSQIPPTKLDPTATAGSQPSGSVWRLCHFANGIKFTLHSGVCLHVPFFRAEASRLKMPCSSLTPSPLVGGISSPEPSAKGMGAAERRLSFFTEMGQRSLPCNAELVMLKMLPVPSPFSVRAQKPSPSSGHSFIAMLPILILT